MVDETVPFCYDKPAFVGNHIGEDLSSFDNVLCLASRICHVID